LLPSVEISLGDFLQKATKETKIGLALNPFALFVSDVTLLTNHLALASQLGLRTLSKTKKNLLRKSSKCCIF
jgi:hypothetical protein